MHLHNNSDAIKEDILVARLVPMMHPPTVVFLSFLTLTVAVKLPSNFQKCNRKQPDLKNCILKAAQNGIAQLTKPFPEIRIPSINPFEIQELSVLSNEGAVGLNQTFRNVKAFGFPQIKIDRYEFDFDNKTHTMDVVFPEVKLEGEFEIKGKVLLLHVNGVGQATVVLKDLRLKSLYGYEQFKKNGKTHIKMVTSEMDIEPGHVEFHFEQLLDQDGFSQNINKVLNDNWKEAFDDVKPSYVEVVSKIIVRLLNGFFSKVSLEEALD
ncbi:unnamed protein product [Tenebrio molitor]|nr:unnamed protein product [Tenebrio molitor]